MHMAGTSGGPSLGDRGSCATGPHKTPTTLGHSTKPGRDIAAIPNTLKQTQGGCQNKETKKLGPSERIEQIFIKRTKQNGYKQPTRCRLQKTGYKNVQ